MKRNDIERQLYEEFNKQKPDLFQQILEECPKMEYPQQKASFFEQLKQALFSRGFRYAFTSLAVLVILLMVVFGSNPATPQAYSILAIEANPSLVLELNEDSTILSVTAENLDAQTILGDMDLVGVDSNVAINAIIGSMLINGYINDSSNSILLSIQCIDESKEEELITTYTEMVRNLLSGSAIEGSIISQRLRFSEDALALSEQLDISEAKAELLLEIAEVDPRSSLEDLAKLSINDLNLLLEAKNYALDNIHHSGSASTLSVLTMEQAYDIALSHYGLDSTTIVEYEIELEQEDGMLLYEIELETISSDYELIINAKDGTILTSSDNEEPVIDDTILSTIDIQTILGEKLNLNPSLMQEFEIELESENTIVFYDISFEYGENEYELEVDARTGEIYSNSQDESGYDYDDD